MNLKTFITILLFLFLALNGGSALCDTGEKEVRDDYARLFNLINDYNASNARAMNEFQAINSRLINEYNSANVRLMNEHQSSNFKLITRYNFVNFILIIVLHSILFIYVTFVLQKIIVKQQRQIDDLKHELEEMKKC